MAVRDLMVLHAWLVRCLAAEIGSPESAREMRRGGGCQVWECLVEGEAVVLKIYSPGFDGYSGLGPADTARKHALALAEMPALGVPTPRLLGVAQHGDAAALAMERVEALPWQRQTRIEAARVLAKLHSTPIASLSTEFMALVSRSRPNRERVGRVPEEPPEPEAALQHGDFFSVNLLHTEGGLRVLDWDLLAAGDPMWDLAFLLEADRGVTEEESAGVISAYEALRPSSRSRLDWHRDCWRSFWRRRDKAG